MTKVPAGPATYVGYLLTLLGGAATAWASASTHPAINAETLLIVTIVAGVLTNLGRQIQAPKGGSEEANVPDAFDALAGFAGEAQANLAKVQASPDGKDGPEVPFAQPRAGTPA